MKSGFSETSLFNEILGAFSEYRHYHGLEKSNLAYSKRWCVFILLPGFVRDWFQHNINYKNVAEANFRSKCINFFRYKSDYSTKKGIYLEIGLR